MDREVDWKVAPQYFAQGTCAVYTISSEQGAFPKRCCEPLVKLSFEGLGYKIALEHLPSRIMLPF